LTFNIDGSISIFKMTHSNRQKLSANVISKRKDRFSLTIGLVLKCQRSDVQATVTRMAMGSSFQNLLFEISAPVESPRHCLMTAKRAGTEVALAAWLY
jgi:hypothetical protein